LSQTEVDLVKMVDLSEQDSTKFLLFDYYLPTPQSQRHVALASAPDEVTGTGALVADALMVDREARENKRLVSRLKFGSLRLPCALRDGLQGVG
jgi:hypothetical protein